MVCTGLLTQGCWLQISIWFYYTTKHLLKMPPASFMHKFIEFLLCPLGHRCEPSEHSGVEVRSAKKSGQKCMVMDAKHCSGKEESGLALLGRWCLY